MNYRAGQFSHRASESKLEGFITEVTVARSDFCFKPKVVVVVVVVVFVVDVVCVCVRVRACVRSREREREKCVRESVCVCV